MSTTMTMGPTRSSASAMSSINTTPLVDVMLVLLIIFMIAAPLFTHQIDFNLPRKTIRAAVIQEALQIDLIGRGNSAPDYRLDGVTVDRSELMRRLRTSVESTPERGFVLRADPTLGFDHVTTAMNLIRRSGLQRGSFETIP